MNVCEDLRICGHVWVTMRARGLCRCVLGVYSRVAPRALHGCQPYSCKSIYSICVYRVDLNSILVAVPNAYGMSLFYRSEIDLLVLPSTAVPCRSTVQNSVVKSSAPKLEARNSAQLSQLSLDVKLCSCTCTCMVVPVRYFHLHVSRYHRGSMYLVSMVQLHSSRYHRRAMYLVSMARPGT